MRRHLPLFSWCFFIGLFCVALFLSLQIHSTIRRFDWKSEIYSDGAGYYAYLPVTFLYQFDYNKFPAGIDDSTGYHFIDHDGKKMVTKYGCGVALMVSPFFGGTVLYSHLAGLPLEGGFSTAFFRMADVAAVFYLVMGLFFIFQVLKRYTGKLVRYLTVIFIFAGTNLYFYTFRQPLMSHVYSFCAISLYLYAIHLFLEKGSWRSFMLVAFSASLAMLIRPVNGTILLLLLFWNVDSFRALKERLRVLFTWRNIATFAIIFFLVFLPQMLYWNYMFGEPIHYSYQGESFSNWNDPKLAEIWFSPLNGLFIWNPVWFVFIAGVLLMIILRERNGILLLVFFLLTSYIIASWHSWFFGCGYGHRAFVDFLPLVAIPFGLITEKVVRIRTRIPAALMILLLSAMSYYNIRIIYHYSGCFSGSVWDWEMYRYYLRNAKLIQKQRPVYVYLNDFENGALGADYTWSDSIPRSYRQSVMFKYPYQTGCRGLLYFYQFAQPFPIHADARVYVYAPDGSTSGGLMHCVITREDRVLWEDTCSIDPFITVPKQWCKVHKKFLFPPNMPWDATIAVELKNPGGGLFFADDLKIIFY